MSALQAVLYTVSDLDQAKAFYGNLLGTPHTDTPYYVGYNVDGQEFAVVPGPTLGTVVNHYVLDINAAIEALQAAGGKVTQEPKDVGGGNLIAVVADPDGTLVGLSQAAGS